MKTPALIIRTIAMAVAVAFTASSASAYQIVFDGEDSSFRVKSGNWILDKTGTFLGNYQFSAAGPGTGSSLAVWDIDGIPDGTYLVEFHVDNGNYAAAAQYLVEDDSGIQTVKRSQNYVGTGWHSIGTFTFTGAGRITQTDLWTGAGTKVIADALRLTLQGEAAPPAEGSAPPEVTIVVDDLGALNPASPGTYTHTLFNQAPGLAYAIIPFLTYSAAVLDDAETKDIETMLHQPLQYIGQADSNPSDPHRLYISMTPTKILQVLDENLTNVAPHVGGLNNHQGSRFSQYRPGLEVMIQNLKDRNMYFLDSRTISDSVAYDIAREKGLLTAERDLFVDGTSVANTKALIETVARQALNAPNYNYVMICHQREYTVPGILQALPVLQSWGVSLKTLERNLHYIVETDKIPPGASVDVNGLCTSTTQDMISHECFDGDALELSTEASSVTFRPALPKAGNYRVFAGNTFSNATINHRSGTAQKVVTANDRHKWTYLGTYPFNAGTAGSVAINATTNPVATTIADSVKFVYDGPLDLSGVTDWQLFQ